MVPFYYSLWYTRAELGKRVGVFIASAPIAGAFGGLIAYGIQHIHSSIATWRILFLVEVNWALFLLLCLAHFTVTQGLPTVVLGFLVLLFLPSRPDITRMLNEEERALALTRMNRHVSNEAAGGINWPHVLSALYDWKILIGTRVPITRKAFQPPYDLPLVCFVYQGVNVALSSISAFLPTLVGQFGYAGANAQLYTVPPYAAAGVVCRVLFLVLSRSDLFSDSSCCSCAFFRTELACVGHLLLAV